MLRRDDPKRLLLSWFVLSWEKYLAFLSIYGWCILTSTLSACVIDNLFVVCCYIRWDGRKMLKLHSNRVVGSILYLMGETSYLFVFRTLMDMSNLLYLCMLMNYLCLSNCCSFQAIVSCEVFVNTNNQSVVRQNCNPEVRTSSEGRLQLGLHFL